MAYDATIRVGADTRTASAQIEGLGKKLRGLENVGKINARNYTQPLGRITGSANEFAKSMEAANARVLAFGAAAGTIYQVQRAFQALVKDTIEVEYSLAKINTLLKQTSKGLGETSAGLFDVARKTGQSFETVAKAAEEFARQGLTATETLKRTRDAMILVRLTGQDTMSAVNGLTAAVNGFNQVGLDTTAVLNKMSRVASNFAVSEKDLSDAFRRVSSVAVDAGVSIDELNGLITAAQQITARGGNVIGNSFKTILTRLQRLRNVKALEQIGVQVRDMEGNFKPAMGVLKALAKEFNNLEDAQKAQVGELIGGVFQINVLKAVMKDLSSEYGIATRATEMSIQATDQAIKKNEQLNKTLKALTNETMANFSEMAASMGKLTLEKPAKRIAAIFNTIFKGLTPDKDAETMGGKIGKGILKGLGEVLAGPGLVMVTVVIAKLMAKFAKFTADAVYGMTKAGQAAQMRVAAEREIIGLLQTDKGLLQMLEKETVDIELVQKRVLAIIDAQIAATRTLAAVSKTVTPAVMATGARPTGAGGFKGPKAAGGFVPAPQAAAETAGAFAGGYAPGKVKSMSIPGFAQRVVYNEAETVKDIGMRQPAILPPKGSKAAKQYDKQFRMTFGRSAYSGGLVPNFAGAEFKIPQAVASNVGMLTAFGRDRSTPPMSVLAKSVPQFQIMAQQYSQTSAGSKALGFKMKGAGGPAAGQNFMMDPSARITISGMQERSLTLGPAEGKNIGTAQGRKFAGQINNLLSDPVKQVANAMFTGRGAGKFGLPDEPVFGDKEAGLMQRKIQSVKGISLPPGTQGDVFEAALTTALGKGSNPFASIDEGRLFDFEEGKSPSGSFKKLFKMHVARADAKRSSTRKAQLSMVNKIFGDQLTRGQVQLLGGGEMAKFLKTSVIPSPGAASAAGKATGKPSAATRLRALGLVPNFALDPNRKREAKQAGVPYGQTYYSYVDTPDYKGAVVGNTRDEPTYSKLKKAVAEHPSPATAGLNAAKGLVPNFAGWDSPYNRDPERERWRDRQRQFDLDRRRLEFEKEKARSRGGPRPTTPARPPTTTAAGNPWVTSTHMPAAPFTPPMEGVKTTFEKPSRFTGGYHRIADAWQRSQIQHQMFQGQITGDTLKALQQGGYTAQQAGAAGGSRFGRVAGMGSRGLQAMFGGTGQAKMMKGFGWTMAAPMAGGALKEAIGDESWAQRGFGQMAESAGKTLSWMGMASMMGGGGGAGTVAAAPGVGGAGAAASAGGARVAGAAGRQVAKAGATRGILALGAAAAPETLGTSVLIAGAVALAIEIPGVVQAFTDTMPDLRKEFERSEKTARDYIKASDQLIQLQAKLIENAGDLTAKEKQLLEVRMAQAVAKLDPEAQKQYSDAMQRGDARGAQTAVIEFRAKQQSRQSAVEAGKLMMNIGGESSEGADDAILDRGDAFVTDKKTGKYRLSGDVAEQFRAAGSQMLGLTGTGGKSVGQLIESDSGVSAAWEQARKTMMDTSGGQVSLDKAVDSLEDALTKAGVEASQMDPMIKGLRTSAKEAFAASLSGQEADSNKLRLTWRKLAEGMDATALKKLLKEQRSGMTKARKQTAAYTAEMRKAQIRMKQFAAQVDLNTKLEKVRISAGGRRAGMAQAHVVQRAGFFTGQEGMASLRNAQQIAAVNRSRDQARANAALDLNNAMAQGAMGTGDQNIAAGLRQLSAGGQRGDVRSGSAIRNDVIKFAAELEKNGKALNAAFSQGPAAFKKAYAAFDKSVTDSADKIENLAQAGAAISSKDQNRMRELMKTSEGLRAQMDKYKASMALADTAHEQELKTLQLKLKLEKEIISIQKKLAVGGGMESLAGMDMTDFAAKLEGIAAAQGSGDLRGGSMAYADMLQSFGAEVPGALRSAIEQELAGRLSQMNEQMGISPFAGSGGVTSVAQTMVDNRYKSEKGIEAMIDQLKTLKDPTTKMSDAIIKWTSGQSAPWVRNAVLEKEQGANSLSVYDKKGEKAAKGVESAIATGPRGNVGPPGATGPQAPRSPVDPRFPQNSENFVRDFGGLLSPADPLRPENRGPSGPTEPSGPTGPTGPTGAPVHGGAPAPGTPGPKGRKNPHPLGSQKALDWQKEETRKALEAARKAGRIKTLKPNAQGVIEIEIEMDPPKTTQQPGGQQPGGQQPGGQQAVGQHRGGGQQPGGQQPGGQQPGGQQPGGQQPGGQQPGGQQPGGQQPGGQQPGGQQPGAPQPQPAPQPAFDVTDPSRQPDWPAGRLAARRLYPTAGQDDPNYNRMRVVAGGIGGGGRGLLPGAIGLRPVLNPAATNNAARYTFGMNPQPLPGQQASRIPLIPGRGGTFNQVGPEAPIGSDIFGYNATALAGHLDKGAAAALGAPGAGLFGGGMSHLGLPYGHFGAGSAATLMTGGRRALNPKTGPGSMWEQAAAAPNLNIKKFGLKQSFGKGGEEAALAAFSESFGAVFGAGGIMSTGSSEAGLFREKVMGLGNAVARSGVDAKTADAIMGEYSSKLLEIQQKASKGTVNYAGAMSEMNAVVFDAAREIELATNKFNTFSAAASALSAKFMKDPNVNIGDLTSTLKEELAKTGTQGGPEEQALGQMIQGALGQWMNTMSPADWEDAGKDIEMAARNLLRSGENWRDVSMMMKQRIQEQEDKAIMKSHAAGEVSTSTLMQAVERRMTTRQTSQAGTELRWKPLEESFSEMEDLFGSNMVDKRNQIFQAMGQLQSSFMEQASFLKQGSPEFVAMRDSIIQRGLIFSQALEDGAISQAAYNQAMQNIKDQLTLERVRTGRAGRSDAMNVLSRRASEYQESTLTEKGIAFQNAERFVKEDERKETDAAERQRLASSRLASAGTTASDAGLAVTEAEEAKKAAAKKVADLQNLPSTPGMQSGEIKRLDGKLVVQQKPTPVLQTPLTPNPIRGLPPSRVVDAQAVPGEFPVMGEQGGVFTRQNIQWDPSRGGGVKSVPEMADALMGLAGSQFGPYRNPGDEIKFERGAYGKKGAGYVMDQQETVKEFYIRAIKDQIKQAQAEHKQRQAELEKEAATRQAHIAQTQDQDKAADKAVNEAKAKKAKADKENAAATTANTQATTELDEATKKATAARKAFEEKHGKTAETTGGGYIDPSKIFGGFQGPEGFVEGLYQMGGANAHDKRAGLMQGINRGMAATESLRPYVADEKFKDDPRRIAMLEQMQFIVEQREEGLITEAEYNRQIENLAKNFEERVILQEQMKTIEKDYQDGMISATEYLRAMGSAENRARMNYENPGSAPGGFGYGAQAAVTEDPWTAAAEWEKMGGEMMNSLKDNFKSAIASMIDGTKSFKEAANEFAMGLLKTMADKMLDYTIDRMFASAFGKKTKKPKEFEGSPLQKAAPELEAAGKKLAADVSGAGQPLVTALKTGAATIQTDLQTAGNSVKMALEEGAMAIRNAALEMNMQGGVPLPATGGPAAATATVNKGGLIKRLNQGGMVTGGSGLKDDVPALMQGGEYVIRKNSVKKYGAEFFEALNQGQMLRAAKGGYVGKKGHLKATNIREKYLMRTYGDKIFESMAQAGNDPQNLYSAIEESRGYAAGGPVEEMDPGLGPKGRLASERKRPRATDSELSIFKAQYLDPLGRDVRKTSVKGLQRKALEIGFTHEQVFGPRGTRPQKKFLGGLLMAATMGMSLYGAMNQPDAQEIKMAGPEYGSQDESLQSFRQGFGAQTRTSVSGGGMGADIRVANATIFEGSDPRDPDSMREIVGVAGQGMTQQEGGIASARAFDPGNMNPLDQMRNARKEAFRKREEDKENYRERVDAANKAYKARRKAIATQAIMSAAFTVGWSMANAPKKPPGPGVGYIDPAASPEANFMKVDPAEAPYGLTKTGEVAMSASETYYAPRNKGGIIRRAAGGGVNPQGKDNIQALLTGGEFVLNPQAVSRIGVHTLHKMNAGSYQPGWSAGGTGRSILANRGGHIRGYQAGGLVGPNVGIPAGIDGDASVEAINKLISTTDSVREAIVGLGTALTPTQQGQAMEQEVVGGGATNNITFNITVEGNGDVAGGTGGGEQGKDENGNEETRKQQREKEMQEMSANLEMAVLKVILEQKRPGGALYDHRRPNS